MQQGHMQNESFGSFAMLCVISLVGRFGGGKVDCVNF